MFFDREETRHLARVLRLGVGARVVVADGQGRVAETEVVSLGSREAVLQVVRELPPSGESPLSLTLCLGLAKGEALDEVVRRATEMGATRLIPFTSAYSEKAAGGRGARRLARWQRLAQESLKVCRRAFLPVIEPVCDFSKALQGPEEMKLIFFEGERQGGLTGLLRGPRPAGVRALIGPEGGFAEAEVAMAKEAGFVAASLGPRRLKVATAAMAALTLLQFAWGDLA